MRTRRLQGMLRLMLCWALGCDQPKPDPLRVELDVFSGRSNPSWELDDRHAAELLQLQGRLTATLEPPPSVPALGYRGFVYMDASGRVRAYRGFVVTTRGVFADPAATVERFLLDQLPDYHAALRNRIAAQLDRTNP